MDAIECFRRGGSDPGPTSNGNVNEAIWEKRHFWTAHYHFWTAHYPRPWHRGKGKLGAGRKARAHKGLVRDQQAEQEKRTT
jgi:hypothetical protein